MKTIFPQDRVMVFNPRLYKDDKSTPISKTMCPATVVCVRGQLANRCGDIVLGPYPCLIDVIFDGEAAVSKGHFLYGVERIK